MRDDYTHICVVLDASGSMSVLHESTVKAFNDFIQSQKKEAGKTVLDIYQFADSTRHIVDSADLAHIHGDLMSDYTCDGCTAMYDAICTAIDTLGKRFAAMPEHERPANVLVAILTDGMENASRKFLREDVAKRIRHQKEVYSWEFIFLAANQDAVLSGGEIGISANDCLDFEMNEKGMQSNFCCMVDRAAQIRKRPRK